MNSNPTIYADVFGSITCNTCNRELDACYPSCAMSFCVSVLEQFGVTSFSPSPHRTQVCPFMSTVRCKTVFHRITVQSNNRRLAGAVKVPHLAHIASNVESNRQ